MGADHAYVAFQFEVLDPIALSDYVARAIPIVAAHGGQSHLSGESYSLHDGGRIERGSIFVCPDRASATAWYDSVEYKALIGPRETALRGSVTLTC
jgi:uncharacterized protein (DUF1330 family)